MWSARKLVRSGPEDAMMAVCMMGDCLATSLACLCSSFLVYELAQGGSFS